jgi:hypothetical protein
MTLVLVSRGTSAFASGPLDGSRPSPDLTVSSLECTSEGQIARYDGTHWVCADDVTALWAQVEALQAQVTALEASLGDLQLQLEAKTTAREQADSRLRESIVAEATARAQTEARLQAHIDAEATAGLVSVDTIGRIEGLEYKLEHLSRNGNELWIAGANLYVVNGEGRTEHANGLGNLIVGYNERRGGLQDVRTGSHMLVVGRNLNYTQFGGIVVGQQNTASGAYASVIGGYGNTASGNFASVSGGYDNTASGELSSVIGGYDSTANGDLCSASGGGAHWCADSLSEYP